MTTIPGIEPADDRRSSRCWFHAVFVLCTFALCGGARAQSLGGLTIPPDRIPGWYTASAVNTTGWTVVNILDFGANPADGADGSDQAALLQAIAAINAAPVATRSILHFPAGTYNLTGIGVGRSNVMLEGEGRDRTILEFSGFSSTVRMPFTGRGCPQSQFITFCGTALPSDQVAITGGAVRGSTTITLASAAAYAVGDWVELSSSYPAGVTEGFQTLGGVNIFSYHARITARSGNSITIDRALRDDLDANPVCKKLHPIENVGIRSLALNYPAPVDSETIIGTLYVVNSSFTDLSFGPKWANVMRLMGTSRSLIAGNIFGDLLKNTPWNKSEMNVGGSCFDNVIENNAFVDDEVAIEIQFGASWNVVAYNYITDVTTPMSGGAPACERSVFFHGNYSQGNLIEGNDVVCVIQSDTFWGQQGPYNTLFRNRTRDPSTSTNPYPLHIGNEAPFGNENPTRLVATFMNVIANSTARLESMGGNYFDARVPSMWIERNVARDRIVLTPLPTTVSRDNAIGTAPPASWANVVIPASLVYPTRPGFWPASKPWPAIGAPNDDRNGTLVTLPAQDMLSGTAPPAPPILIEP